MEVGVHIPQVGPMAARPVVEEFARAVGESGYDGLWVYDHVVVRREQGESRYPYSASGQMGVRPELDFLEPLTELAFLAGITSRVRLGTSVLVLPMRQPVLHAKIMASIDHLSGCRFVLGAGIGWWKEEYEVMGVPFESRGRRMDECLQLVRAMWTEDFVDFRGKFYEVVDWACNPKPSRGASRPGGIPIWLGGESLKQMERIGKYADGWQATPKSLATLKDDFAIARESAVNAGRDPNALTITIEGAGVLAPDGLDETAERMHRLKEMGVLHAIVGVHPRHMMEARPVLEAFAAKHLKALQA